MSRQKLALTGAYATPAGSPWPRYLYYTGGDASFSSGRGNAQSRKFSCNVQEVKIVQFFFIFVNVDIDIFVL